MSAYTIHIRPNDFTDSHMRHVRCGSRVDLILAVRSHAIGVRARSKEDPLNGGGRGERRSDTKLSD